MPVIPSPETTAPIAVAAGDFVVTIAAIEPASVADSDNDVIAVAAFDVGPDKKIVVDRSDDGIALVAIWLRDQVPLGIDLGSARWIELKAVNESVGVGVFAGVDRVCALA